MRHQRAGLRLSRTSAHRRALFSNLVAALITRERIRTTDAKAKETRRIAERTITWARRVGDVLGKTPELRTPDEAARVVHAVRQARRVVRDRAVLAKLFGEVGRRYAGRAGGYTRIVKLGARVGDGAPMCVLELMPGDGAGDGATGVNTKGKERGGRSAAGEGARKASGEGRGQGRVDSGPGRGPSGNRVMPPAQGGSGGGRTRGNRGK